MKKQTKKQIKHWKRSSKRQGLSSRALVKKDIDPLVNQRGKKYFYDETFDPYWDVYEAYEDDYFYYDYEESVYHYILHYRLFDELLKLPQSPFSELGVKYNVSNGKKAKCKYDIKSKHFKIEKLLFEHLKEFSKIKAENLQERLLYLRHFAGSYTNIEKVISISEANDNRKIAKAVMFFTPFWLIEPECILLKDLESFIKKLFIEYDVPVFLFKEWYNDTRARYGDEDVLRLKWLSWFLIIAQGGSLKKAAKLFRWNISSDFQYHLAKVPHDISPISACIYAKVLSLGGIDTDARRILSNRAYVVDITEEISEGYYKFWISSVTWLIKNREQISDEEAEVILLWAMHKYAEVNRGC